jgi:hypothetical protein
MRGDVSDLFAKSNVLLSIDAIRYKAMQVAR